MIAVISHDAGGAEIISSWLSQNSEPFKLVLGGPAVTIFQNKLGEYKNYPLESAIRNSDWVLCGTSWQSSLEKLAIVKAKLAGKRVVAFLDHWVNYHERFVFDGAILLPDEIWVTDLYAQKIANNIFPSLKVVLNPNPYFADLHLKIQSLQPKKIQLGKYSILYVCEPIREHALLAFGNEFHWGYTEETALGFFLKNINAVGRKVTEIRIRPHPSEIRGKYDWVQQENTLVTEVMSSKSLIEQIVEADAVVGCGSMAMVVALLAKKRVISSIPPGGKPCELPHSEIEHLQDLVHSHKETLVG